MVVGRGLYQARGNILSTVVLVLQSIVGTLKRATQTDYLCTNSSVIELSIAFQRHRCGAHDYEGHKVGVYVRVCFGRKRDRGARDYEGHIVGIYARICFGRGRDKFRPV